MVEWTASVGPSQTIKLWDTASGKELRTLLGHNGAVFDLSFMLSTVPAMALGDVYASPPSQVTPLQRLP